MTGLVFTEFLELVDEQFSFETCEQIIEMSDLPSGGVYTSVGTYQPQEMAALLGNLSELTGIPAPHLLQMFGRPLFRHFVATFPVCFEGITSSLEFLPFVNDYVHMEVRKLYPDADLPTFTCETPRPGTMVMTYRSKTDLPDLAEGLILGCIDHNGEPPETVFTITPK